MVKQFEDTRRTTTALALATDPRDYADDDELELAVSVVASVGVQTIREERDLVVLAGPGKLRAETPPLLLDDCSAIALSSAGAGVTLLGRRVVREAPEASVAMLVTGSVPARRRPAPRRPARDGRDADGRRAVRARRRRVGAYAGVAEPRDDRPPRRPAPPAPAGDRVTPRPAGRAAVDIACLVGTLALVLAPLLEVYGGLTALPALAGGLLLGTTVAVGRCCASLVRDRGRRGGRRRVRAGRRGAGRADAPRSPGWSRPRRPSWTWRAVRPRPGSRC